MLHPDIMHDVAASLTETIYDTATHAKMEEREIWASAVKVRIKQGLEEEQSDGEMNDF